MRRRVDIAIDRVTVDPSLAGDRGALRAAIEAALQTRLSAPGAAHALRPSDRPVVEADATGRGGLPDRVGSAIAGTVSGGRE
jgi:hypothetical protein